MLHRTGFERRRCFGATMRICFFMCHLAGRLPATGYILSARFHTAKVVFYAAVILEMPHEEPDENQIHLVRTDAALQRL